MPTAIPRLLSLARLGLIHPKLLVLAWKIKHSGRTFLSYPALHSLAKNFIRLNHHHPGQVQVAEFGVGRGGSAILLAWLVERFGGHLTLYDLFGRIPEPTEIDGERARQRYEGILTTESPDYYGNLPDLLGLVTKELHEVCRPERIEIIPGKYEDTLVDLNDTRAFHQVHIDCDWYESSMVVYQYLRTRLIPGATIQIDDYSDWEGSRRAFEDTAWLSYCHTRLVDGALVVDTSRVAGLST
jgi:hypothetical protein